MHRALYACALSAALLGTPPARAADPAPAAPPAAAPGASASPAAKGKDITVDPSRVEEARSLIPPPLLYGRFRPDVGSFVEYDVSTKKGRTRARAALVGKTARPDGSVMYQLEVDFPETKPRTMVVLWLVGEERPLIETLALSVAPHTPISMPVDLYADLPELRGNPSPERETTIKAGPFAGKATQRSWKLPAGGTSEVVTSDKVPVFGVESVQAPEGTWVARKTGTGAKPELSAVPLAVPRFPETL